ncbi:MAG TPA: Smr/MutS family protein [Sandaracinaceae bacterium LLY-WYZ-13_1]|nr:Smr/MutS family protein [Sandaracinaceae bacterium LLY-WYZ-13_1]
MGRRKKKKRRESESAEAKPTPPTTKKKVGTSLKSLLADVQLEEPSAKKSAPKQQVRRTTPARRAEASRAGGSRDEASRPDGPARSDDPARLGDPVEPRPSESLRGEDRIAFFDAIAGVKPLDAPNRAVSGPKPAPARPAPPGARTADDDARARLAALVAGGVRFEIERADDLVRGRRAGVSPRAAEALERKGVVPEATLDLHGQVGDEAERAVVRFVRREQRRGARRVCIVHGKGRHSEGGVGVLRDRVIHALTEGGAAPVVHAFASASARFGGSGALMVELSA